MIPTKPWEEVGFWIEPAVSSARPSAAKPDETAVAVPALLAPGARPSNTGLSVAPAQLCRALLHVADVEHQVVQAGNSQCHELSR